MDSPARYIDQTILSLLTGERRDSHRREWQQRRKQMEASVHRQTRDGQRAKGRLLHNIGSCIEPALASIGLRSRALANVLAVQVRHVDIGVPSLPAAFDGYRILHISDLHVGRVPGLMERVAQEVSTVEADLAVLTGDLQTWGTPAAASAVQGANCLFNAVQTRDGIVGILGNHDTHNMVEHLERRGVRMLVNEHATIRHSGGQIHVTGLDDVHYFYTDDAAHTLRGRPPDGCAIVLVHSPEMADLAADAGYALYLSGHTHGGQICLPNRTPIFTAVDRHRGFASGLWRYREMVGYTSRGVGVAWRARFNCPPEVTVLRLRRPFDPGPSA